MWQYAFFPVPRLPLIKRRNVATFLVAFCRAFGSERLGRRWPEFRQIDLDKRDTHHDALEFPDGRIVEVTNLCEGQTVTVLQLPVSAGEATVTEEQRTNSLVV